MKNVKTLLIFIVISSFMFAGWVRTNALGGAGYWADDYANTRSFPAEINNHSGAWTTGGDITYLMDVDGTTWGFNGGTGDDVANIMWGNGEMGVSFGLSMDPAVAVGDIVNGVAATAATDAETGLSVGFGMPLSGMDFGGSYAMGPGAGGGMIGLNLRRAQDLWVFENILVGFGMTMEEAEAGVIETASKMDLDVDLYRNTDYDNGISSLLALGLRYGSAGAATTGGIAPDATTGIEWNMGVEAEMTDWATLRVGYSHGYDFSTGGTDDADNGINCGLGFNYGALNLDLTIGTALFSDPVVYMTGQNRGEGGANSPLASNFELSYTW